AAPAAKKAAPPKLAIAPAPAAPVAAKQAKPVKPKSPPPAGKGSQPATPKAPPPTNAAGRLKVKSAKAASRKASERSTPASGLAAEWIRPGLISEEHIWFVPHYGTRPAQRRFLGIPFGTYQQKFVERYDEQKEERATGVDGHHTVVTSLAFSTDGRLLA